MTLHRCQRYPYCLAELPSVYARSLHNAEVHNAYENGEYVEGKTERSLQKVGARVLRLLRTEPETRNPKNWPLWTRYLQIYSKTHILVYDARHQGWMVNRPDGVLDADALRELFAEIETARRRRQDYQRADMLLYHNPEDIDSQLAPHTCILPRKKDRILARMRYAVMRNHYKPESSVIDSFK